MPNFKLKKVETLPTSGYSTGDIYFVSSEKKIYIRTESGWEDYGGASDTILASIHKSVVLNSSNTTDTKAANAAALKAYADNLKKLGVDVSRGYIVPITLNYYESGFLSYYYPYPSLGVGIVRDRFLIASNISVTSDGTVSRTQVLDNKVTYSELGTTKKTIFGAINEVNNLTKGKQDALVSGTNIKTVNGQSLLGSGDVTISGGGTSPLLIDLAELSGEVGTIMTLDIFNELVEAAKNSTPVFGYLENTDGSKTTYALVPLSVTHISSTSSALTINYIRANAAYNIGIMKRSDTECQIMVNSSRSLALATSVSNASSVAVQSDAVWKAIHAEPLTVNTATSGVTSLTSSSNHKILCNVTSGTQQYNLPASPLDGETFMFLKVNSGHTLVIQSGTGSSNVFDCAAGTSNITKTIGSNTKRKITVTYSSSAGKWFLMADDFLS